MEIVQAIETPAQLVENLAVIALEKAGRLAFAKDRIHDGTGEETSQDGAQGPARAMHAKGVQRVVITKDILDL